MLLSTLLQQLLPWLRLCLLFMLVWPLLLLLLRLLLLLLLLCSQLGLVPIPKVQRGSIGHTQRRLVQPATWRLLSLLRLLARPVAMLQRW